MNLLEGVGDERVDSIALLRADKRLVVLRALPVDPVRFLDGDGRESSDKSEESDFLFTRISFREQFVRPLGDEN